MIKTDAPIKHLDIGGGFPIKNSLAFDFDYQYMITEIVGQIKSGAVSVGAEHPSIFTEFGSAVVGLFGAKPAGSSQPKSTQSTSLQKALDSQLNEEVGNRSSRRSDGQPLIAL